MKYLRLLLALACVAISSDVNASRGFTTATTDRLTTGTALVVGVPVTISCWMHTTAVTENGVLVSLINSATNAANYLTFRGAVGGDPVGAQSWDGVGAVAAALSAGSVSVNTWHHVGGVWSAADNRAVFLDGAKTSETTSVTVAGQNQTNVGVFLASSTCTYSGQIAEVGIWNVALTDAEMASLAKGCSPTRVRPQSLVAYFPLVGTNSPETDVKGNTLTVTGPVQFFRHPRIYRN